VQNSGRYWTGFLVVLIVLADFSELLSPRSRMGGGARADGNVPFTHVVIDAAGPRGSGDQGIHTKAVGDLNGDGYPDAIVAGSTVGEPLVWYASPGWDRHVVSTLGGWSTDAAVGDLDNDGDQDIAISSWYRSDAGIEWFENLGGGLSWAHHAIGPPAAHDLELADLDLDGDPDLVTRLQAEQGNAIELWVQENAGQWSHRTLRTGVPPGEGLAVRDLDGDGDPDIVIGGSWFENPRDATGGEWTPHVFTTAWTRAADIVAVDDVNRDGRLDVVLTPSEPAGDYYHISWFEAPADPRSGDWTEHIIDASVECVMHSLQLADIDKDGDADVVTAKMEQGADPDDVSVYYNVGQGGRGANWVRQVISTEGSHELRAADFDRDGDVDLLGANWRNSATVDLWQNDLNNRLSLDNWSRRVVDEARPWNAVFITAGDLDGDGLLDIIAGGWWYGNPGRPDGTWERRAIGSPLNNMAAVFDYNLDGKLDVLGTPWAGSGADSSFRWAVNDGAGSFTVLDNVPAGQGDFLQGVAAGRFRVRGPIETALSWHNGTGQGIQMLTTPADPLNQPWAWRRLTSTDQQEQLTMGDIDRDGDMDLLLGTMWLRNDNGSYTLLPLSTTTDPPDRSRLADVNRDGRLDAVVGFVGISTPAKLAWYEQPADAAGTWAEHVVATVVGPMSLDVADIDRDGDIDVVVGEHNLAQPETARLIVFENADARGGTWQQHVVYTGDEHHDGAQLADMDGDGDLDIISVGWGHPRVLLYRNQAMESGIRLPNAGPQPVVLPPSTPPSPGAGTPTGTSSGNSDGGNAGGAPESPSGSDTSGQATPLAALPALCGAGASVTLGASSLVLFALRARRA
jgi:hypothetical protein